MRSAVWCAAIHCRRAAVSSSSGYSYFGCCTDARWRSSSQTRRTSSPSAGSLSATYSLGSEVTKAVRTIAPFSYVMSASQTMTSQRSSQPEKAVRDGQKRKKGMPRAR